MSETRLRMVMRLLGAVLGLLGLLFIGAKFVQYATQISWHKLGIATAVLLMPACLLHVGGGVLLGLAWREILGNLRVVVTRRWAVVAFGASQIARYVPGNIFQYVGRQAIGKSAGIGSAALLKSTLWEIGCIVSTSSLFGGLYWLIVWEKVPPERAIGVFTVTAGLVIMVVGRVLSPHLGRAVAFHAIYLAVVGAIFASFLASQLFVHSVWDWSLLLVFMSAHVVAWLVGLLTPGSPAGLGVRETALYGLLHHMVGDGELLTAILLSRVVNVMGDGLFYLWAIWNVLPLQKPVGLPE